MRDRGVGGEGPIRFTSAILPVYLRRTTNIEELLPWPYLKGVSTGRFGEALAALLGRDAPGLSAATARRLTGNWQEEHARSQQRDLSARRYVYIPPRSPDRGPFGHGSAGVLPADGPTASTSSPGSSTSGKTCWC